MSDKDEALEELAEKLYDEAGKFEEKAKDADGVREAEYIGRADSYTAAAQFAIKKMDKTEDRRA